MIIIKVESVNRFTVVVYNVCYYLFKKITKLNKELPKKLEFEKLRKNALINEI